MPATLDLPDVTAPPLQFLIKWLARPETQKRMQTAVSEAVAAVDNYILSSTSRRVPRQPEERENSFRSWLDAFAARGFEHWLNDYKHQLARSIQQEVLLEFSEFNGLRNRDMIREMVEATLWPEMEPLLQNRAEELLLTYAVRGIALTWVSRHLGDGLLVGLPERQESDWLIPLHTRNTQALVTSVKLDKNGEVLSDKVTLRIDVETAL